MMLLVSVTFTDSMWTQRFILDLSDIGHDSEEKLFRDFLAFMVLLLSMILLEFFILPQHLTHFVASISDNKFSIFEPF